MQITMGAGILADVDLIVLSVVMINLSEKGQYPCWWLGYSWENAGGTMYQLRETADGIRKYVSKTNYVEGEQMNHDEPV